MQGMKLPLNKSSINSLNLKKETEPISETTCVLHELILWTKSKYIALNYVSHHCNVTWNLTSPFAKENELQARMIDQLQHAINPVYRLYLISESILALYKKSCRHATNYLLQ